MTRCLMLLCSAMIALLLTLIGCAKQVPVSPDPSDTEAASALESSMGGLNEDESASQRQQELRANIEEQERRVVEESMRRRFGEQPPGPTGTPMTREEFLNQDVLFGYDSYTLGSNAKGTLEQKATWLAVNPDFAVQIEGHCDERGTIAYNLALGERRANTVKQYMAALGIDSSRLSTISYGEEFPLDPGHSEAAWTRNRRAHFAIVNQ